MANVSSSPYLTKQLSNRGINRMDWIGPNIESETNSSSNLKVFGQDGNWDFKSWDKENHFKTENFQIGTSGIRN